MIGTPPRPYDDQHLGRNHDEHEPECEQRQIASDDVESLRRELHELRARLAIVERGAVDSEADQATVGLAVVDGATATSTGLESAAVSDPGQAGASRRNLLRLAGATAVGVVASTVSAGRAAADTGYTLGGATSVGDVVRQQLNGSRPNEFGFLFATHGFALTSNNTSRPAAVGIGNFDPAVARGLYAFTTTPGGIGIDVQAPAPGSIGILCESTGAGIDSTANGVGGNGVRGRCEADGGVGVVGYGGAIGVQGYAESTTGVGGSFAGYAGALQLGAWPGPSVPDRTVAHVEGVVQRDEQGDVWYCVSSGTPGSWRKIAGRSSAGAFHAIDPVRVYDSRAAAPAPGALARGQQRLISAADGRDLASGAVTVARVVPAGATAVAVNLTITSTVGSGYLSVTPGTTESLGASSINWWTDGITIANGLIVALDDQRRLKVFCEGSPGCSAHVIVDVQGYWR